MKAVLNYIVNTVIALLILLMLQLLFAGLSTAYYTYMPIETFYESVSFTADNACIGDSHHLVHSKRIVHGTEIGYGAEVIREMFLLQDGREVKVLEEHAMPFMEVRADGMVTRQQFLPSGLKAGEYQWVAYLTLNVHGVQRSDIPPVVSNIFTITYCV